MTPNELETKEEDMDDISVGDLVQLKPHVMFGTIGPPLTVKRITKNWLFAAREGRLAVQVRVRLEDVDKVAAS